MFVADSFQRQYHARRAAALTIGLATTPFDFEGLAEQPEVAYWFVHSSRLNLIRLA